MLALHLPPAPPDPAPLALDADRLRYLPAREVIALAQLAAGALLSATDVARRRALTADLDECLDELAGRTVPRAYWQRDLLPDRAIVEALRARTQHGTLSPALSLAELAALGGMRRIRPAVARTTGHAIEVRIFPNARTVILRSRAFPRRTA